MHRRLFLLLGFWFRVKDRNCLPFLRQHQLPLGFSLCLGLPSLPDHTFHPSQGVSRPHLSSEIQLRLLIRPSSHRTPMQYPYCLNVRREQPIQLLHTYPAQDSPQTKCSIDTSAADSDHVSGKGLVGCIGGVIIPSLDFEDRADWETRFRGLVKEGSA